MGQFGFGKAEARVTGHRAGKLFCGCANRIAVGFVGKFVGLAEADQQYAGRSDAGQVVKHEGRARLVVEVTASQYGGDGAVAGLVEGSCGSGQIAVGVSAGNHAAALEFFRRSGLYGKFHPLLLGNTRQ